MAKAKSKPTTKAKTKAKTKKTKPKKKAAPKMTPDECYNSFMKCVQKAEDAKTAKTREVEDIHRALECVAGRDPALLRLFLSESLSPEAKTTVLTAIPGPNEVAASWLVKALAERGQLGAGQITRALQGVGSRLRR